MGIYAIYMRYTRVDGRWALAERWAPNLGPFRKSAGCSEMKALEANLCITGGRFMWIPRMPQSFFNPRQLRRAIKLIRR